MNNIPRDNPIILLSIQRESKEMIFLIVFSRSFILFRSLS
jgi:hypothetical protein